MIYFLFAASNPIVNKLEKANMLIFRKKATDKDRSLKTKLFVSTNNNDDKISDDRVWRENGFFGEIRPDLKLEKRNIPENCLFYVNQAFLSTVKNGHLAMYVDNFILGKLIPAGNQPEHITT